MARALIDTTVLFAGAYRRDERHDTGRAILQAIDSGACPETVVLDYVLAETMNGLLTHAGHVAAVDMLDRIEENRQFDVVATSGADLTGAKGLFRSFDGLSLVDSAIVAHARSNDIEYCYSFDDDFDAVDPPIRLDAPVNPFDPK